MKIFRIMCVVKRLDNVRALFFENVLTDTPEAALKYVEHFKTTYPAPKEFAASVSEVFEQGDPTTPKADDCHPRFWGVA